MICIRIKEIKKFICFWMKSKMCPNWELFVRRIYDTLNVEIFLTGSSSKLLTAEIATSLRGRTITYEIFFHFHFPNIYAFAVSKLIYTLQNH